ncbi:hypothetical protein BFL43_18870 [Williamsia sp. 1135]|nr:hypothetical protein BFL43_18870 [Williamsia sp. 1135]
MDGHTATWVRSCLIALASCAIALLGVVMPSTARADPPPAEVGAGTIYYTARGITCYVTSAGHTDGKAVALTAGHCGNIGDQIALTPGGTPIGRFVARVPPYDVAVIVLDESVARPSAGAAGSEVHGIAAPPTFPGVVCKSSRLVGRECGVVWGNLADAPGEVANQTCSVSGDSGAPVVDLQGRLVAMNNGHLVAPETFPIDLGCTNPASPVHVPAYATSITEVFAAMHKAGVDYRPVP